MRHSYTVKDMPNGRKEAVYEIINTATGTAAIAAASVAPEVFTSDIESTLRKQALASLHGI